MKIKNFQVSQSVSIVTISSKVDRCTIGYRRINRMVQVAVSYCAPGDKWKATTGQTIVQHRLQCAADTQGLEGVISLPIGKQSEGVIQSTLSYMFFGMPID